MTDYTRTIAYWGRAEAAVLLMAAGIALAGAAAWSLTIPRPPVGAAGLILPSCATWMLLAPFIARHSWRRALLIGLISPFIGSLFVILMGVGVTQEIVREDAGQFISSLPGVLVYAFAFIGISAWVTLPVGAVAGLATWQIFRWMPPPEIPVSASKRRLCLPLGWRIFLSALPLVPLLGLLIPYQPIPPSRVISPWRLLTELYFFPVFLIDALSVRMESFRFLTAPSITLAMKIAFAVLLSVALYRKLARSALAIQRTRSI